MLTSAEDSDPSFKPSASPKHVLITGGAGFIGSHLADRLLAEGHHVRALDNLSPQVHGQSARRPIYLDPDVELMVGDVRDTTAVRRALLGVDVVFHLAARVGVGQSMYEIALYTEVNNVGTATLLEAISQSSIERLVVASSMSIYGEGLYRDCQGRTVTACERSLDQLKRSRWDVLGSEGERLDPLPTPESKLPALASVYALSKYDQERMSLLVGRAYGVPTVALRFFNVYGPRQALSNPYTGVLAIFGSRLLNGRPPLVNEDGQQRRDFVSVHDVARACVLAMTAEGAVDNVFNVGSGASYSVRDIAERVAAALERDIPPEITGRFRVGDIRHCYADITRARQVLGYEPRVDLFEGLRELAEWLAGQEAVDRVEIARAELAQRGLAP
jgi:dTDP-L-rhamnose 4-epimerase